MQNERRVFLTTSKLEVYIGTTHRRRSLQSIVAEDRRIRRIRNLRVAYTVFI
jgi:hypothetical protein